MSKTDEDTIRGLVNLVSEPVLIVIPNQMIGDEEMVRIFKTLEDILLKIEDKLGIEFDILIESAVYFGGYNEMSDLVSEQRDDSSAVPEGVVFGETDEEVQEQNEDNNTASE